MKKTPEELSLCLGWNGSIWNESSMKKPNVLPFLNVT